METAGVTTKITKSNSTPTPIRKVKDQPLQRIPINGTEKSFKIWDRVTFFDSVRC